MKLLLAAMAALSVAAPAAAQEAVGRSWNGAAGPSLVKRAHGHVTEVRGALKRVLARVEEARGARDVARLSCVAEKLAQVEQLLRVAEGAELGLRKAAAESDPRADAEYSRIASVSGRVDRLRAAADECLGQLAYLVDEKTSVEVQQPEDVPPELLLRADPPVGAAGGSREATASLVGKAGAGFGPGRAEGLHVGPPPRGPPPGPPPPVHRPPPASRCER